MGRRTRKRGAHAHGQHARKERAWQPGEPRAERPSVYLDDTVLVREIPFIEKVLRACQVATHDLADVVQDVLFGAWKSMQMGRFRPPPGEPLSETIRAWLFGVAWRQASHYRCAAHRRREVLSTRLCVVLDGVPLVENQVVARGLLEIFQRLPLSYQEVLGLVGLGAKIQEVADELGVTLGTANTRIQRARKFFLRTLRRRGKAPKSRRRG